MDGLELTQEEALTAGLSTYRVGWCQMSTMDVPGRPHEVYIVNFITPPEHRREGDARRLFKCVRWVADEGGLTLVVHPDKSEGGWLYFSTLKYNFGEDWDRAYQGMPLLVRPPQPRSPRPDEMDRLEVVQP